MIPSAYQCEFPGCTAEQHDGTAFCLAHLELMRARRSAEMDADAKDKDERFMAMRREAEALDNAQDSEEAA